MLQVCYLKRMLKFPMKFQVEASAPSGILTQWTARSDALPPIPSAIPPEFTGPGGGYSPEDLFALSVLNCMIATYKVYMEKSKVSFENVEGRAVLTVDKHPSEPVFTMAHIEFFFDVTGSSDREKARVLLEKAIKDCAVSNSIKSGKSFHLNIL
jgi:uncharacterized OsmC-like protein